MLMIPPSGGDSFTGNSGFAYSASTNQKLQVGSGDVSMALARNWNQATTSEGTNSLSVGTGNGDIQLNGGEQFWSLEQTTGQTYGLSGPVDTSVNSNEVDQLIRTVNAGSGNAIIKPNANVAGQYINDNSGLTNNEVTLTPGQWAIFYLALSQANQRTYWALFTNGTIS